MFFLLFFLFSFCMVRVSMQAIIELKGRNKRVIVKHLDSFIYLGHAAHTPTINWLDVCCFFFFCLGGRKHVSFVSSLLFLLFFFLFILSLVMFHNGIIINMLNMFCFFLILNTWQCEHARDC